MASDTLKHIFRPREEPARLLYDAVLDEAQHRSGHADWIERERARMLKEAVSYAESHGLFVPSIEDVQACERNADGHVDYLAKWARGVAAVMTLRRSCDRSNNP